MLLLILLISILIVSLEVTEVAVANAEENVVCPVGIVNVSNGVPFLFISKMHILKEFIKNKNH